MSSQEIIAAATNLRIPPVFSQDIARARNNRSNVMENRFLNKSNASLKLKKDSGTKTMERIASSRSPVVDFTKSQVEAAYITRRIQGATMNTLSDDKPVTLNGSHRRVKGPTQAGLRLQTTPAGKPIRHAYSRYEAYTGVSHPTA